MSLFYLGGAIAVFIRSLADKKPFQWAFTVALLWPLTPLAVIADWLDVKKQD